MKSQKNAQNQWKSLKMVLWSSQENAYNSWTEHDSELGLVLFCRRSGGESNPIKKLEILNFPNSDFSGDFRKTLENHKKLAFCYIAG